MCWRVVRGGAGEPGLGVEVDEFRLTIDRCSDQCAVLALVIRTHRAQWRRVDVDRRRRDSVFRTKTVDVRGGEADRLAGLDKSFEVATAKAEPFFEDATLHHVHGATGDVVVVETRVVVVDPRDDVDLV